MIMRLLTHFLVLITALLLQAVVAPSMAVAGVVPNLVMLTVLMIALFAGPGMGVRYGFAAGLSLDILSGGEAILGVSALLLLLAGYGAGLAGPYIAASQISGQMIVGGAGVLALLLAEGLFSFMLGREPVSVLSLLQDAALSGLYAALLAPILGMLVGRLQRGLPEPG